MQPVHAPPAHCGPHVVPQSRRFECREIGKKGECVDNMVNAKTSIRRKPISQRLKVSGQVGNGNDLAIAEQDVQCVHWGRRADMMVVAGKHAVQHFSGIYFGKVCKHPAPLRSNIEQRRFYQAGGEQRFVAGLSGLFSLFHDVAQILRHWRRIR